MTTDEPACLGLKLDNPWIVDFLRQDPERHPPVLFPHQNEGPDLVLILIFTSPTGEVLRVPLFVQLKRGSVAKIGSSVFTKLQPAHFDSENRAIAVASSSSSSSSSSSKSRRTKKLSVPEQYVAVHASLQETLADIYGGRYLSLLVSTPALKKSVASQNNLCWCVDRGCFIPADQALNPSQSVGEIGMC